jgi:PhnB protein
MSKVIIPGGYQPIMPYLIIEHASAFSKFMQDAFGAKEKFREMRDECTIKHAELELSGGTIMFADATEQYTVQNAGLFVYVADCDECFKRAVADGATILSEPADQPYGRSAGIQDAFGNTWWMTAVDRP